MVRRPGAVIAALGLASTLFVAGPLALPRVASAAFCDTQPDEYCALLEVALIGNGTASIVSSNDPANAQYISCQRASGITTGQCFHEYYVGSPGSGGYTVNLALAPATGSEVCDSFGCVQFPTTYPVTVTSDVTVSFTARLVAYDLQVSLGGAGSGYVVMDNGDTCEPACSASYPYQTEIEMHAVANAGSTFTSWSGACAGQDASCTLSITNSVSTQARFALNATPKPSAAATPKAPTTPRPGPSPTSTVAPTTAPTGTPASPASGESPTTTAPGPSQGPSMDAGASGVGAPAAILPTSPELTIVALAVLGAGLLIGLGIFAGFALRRRERPGPPEP